MPSSTSQVREREKALLAEGFLACRKCDQVRAIGHFGLDPRTAHGLRVWCKDCTNHMNRRYVAANPVGKEKKIEYQRRYREKNGPLDPAHIRRKNLWRLYKITPEDYDRMLTEQGGVCAICGSSDPKVRLGAKFFHVDHDRETGKVRGLLCGSCNPALGAFQDDPVILQSAINYLSLHEVTS